MKYGVTYAGPRRTRVRRDWRGTVLTLLTLLTLAALAAWLLHVLRDAGDGVSSFILYPSSFPVAMAPVPQGGALLVVLMAAGLIIWWSVVAERKVSRARAEEWDREVMAARKAREARERVWREARRKAQSDLRWSVGPLEVLNEAEGQEEEGVMTCPHCKSGLLFGEDRGAHCDGCDQFDPEVDLRWAVVGENRLAACFTEETDEDRLAACFTVTEEEVRTLGVGLEDLRRIVGALRAEVRSARELVMLAELQDGGYIDLERLRVLREALAALHQCVGCVDGLAVAVGAEGKDEGSKMKDERGAA